MLKLWWNFSKNSICNCRISCFVCPVVKIIKRALHIISWYLRDLSRLFVRVKLASRCSCSIWLGFFDVVRCSSLFLVQIFDNKIWCFAIDSINKCLEWQWLQNQGIVIALKNLHMLLISFTVNTSYITQKLRFGMCFLMCACYLLHYYYYYFIWIWLKY